MRGQRSLGLVINQIKGLVPERIRNIRPYQVHSARGLIKLDAMENPYPMPAVLKEEWLGYLSAVEINRYPDPSATELKSQIAKVFSVPDELSMVLGNGSDELIQMIVTLVGGPGKTIMAPVPTFSMYELISQVSDSKFVGVALNSQFEIEADHFVEEIRTYNPDCIFLSHPNNPTGNAFSAPAVEKIIAAANGLVIMDEAYFAFSRDSYLPKISGNSNVLIMRTLSKSGLAGLRMGILIGADKWLNELEKVRLPYNINSLTQASAEFCLHHYRVFEQQAEQILRDRSELINQLTARKGISIFPTEANFILFRSEIDAPSIYQGLKDRGVLIRLLHQENTVLHNCLRVTVGTREENQAFLQALDACLLVI